MFFKVNRLRHNDIKTKMVYWALNYFNNKISFLYSLYSCKIRS